MQEINKKPTPEQFGWHSATSFEEESGWMAEGGEDEYYKALEKWETERKYKLPNDAGKVTATIVSKTHTAIEYTTATNPKGRIYHEILGNWILKSQIGEVLTLIKTKQND